MTELELNWVAGILEGEGSFGFAGKLSKKRTLRISCGMTDKDVIDRLHGLCGGTVAIRHWPRWHRYKTLYVWTLSKRLEVVDLLIKLKPLMGVRRSLRIEELLAYHKENPLRKVGLEHGTIHGYVAYKCRCEFCKSAGNAYQRAWYAKKQLRESCQ